MRYGSAWLLLIAPLMGNASELTQWEKNDIRKHYQEEVFNRPATVRNQAVDQRYIDEISRDPVIHDSTRYAAMPEIPSLRVFAGRELQFEKFIEMLSKTLGYNSPIFLHIPVSISKTPIIVNSEMHDLAQLIDWLELKSGTKITVYPEAKTIQVTAENDFTSSGSGTGRL